MKKPFGSLCLVFLLEPYPTLGILRAPLNFLRTRLSIPLGFLQLCYKEMDYNLSLHNPFNTFTLRNRSLWKRIKCFLLFFTVGIVFNALTIFKYYNNTTQYQLKSSLLLAKNKINKDFIITLPSKCLHWKEYTWERKIGGASEHMIWRYMTWLNRGAREDSNQSSYVNYEKNKL